MFIQKEPFLEDQPMHPWRKIPWEGPTCFTFFPLGCCTEEAARPGPWTGGEGAFSMYRVQPFPYSSRQPPQLTTRGTPFTAAHQEPDSWLGGQERSGMCTHHHHHPYHRHLLTIPFIRIIKRHASSPSTFFPLEDSQFKLKKEPSLFCKAAEKTRLFLNNSSLPYNRYYI